MQAQTLAASTPVPRFAENFPVLHALVLVGLQLASIIVVMAVIAPAILRGQDLTDGSPRAFLVIAIGAAIQIGGVVSLGIRRWGRVTLHDLGWSTDHLGRNLAFGIAGFVLCGIAVFGASMAAGATLGELVAAVAGYSLQQRLVFLGIGVVAGIVEESLFRGHLQSVLGRRMGGTLGWIATAAIFSLYHLNFRPTSLLVKFAFGLVWGALRRRSGSLVPSAVSHAVVWVVIGTL